MAPSATRVQGLRAAARRGLILAALGASGGQAAVASLLEDGYNGTVLVSPDESRDFQRSLLSRRMQENPDDAFKYRIVTPQCPEGYYDRTKGVARWWDCGVRCPGGPYTDFTCNCACERGELTDPPSTTEIHFPVVLPETTTKPPPVSVPPTPAPRYYSSGNDDPDDPSEDDNGDNNGNLRWVISGVVIGGLLCGAAAMGVYCRFVRRYVAEDPKATKKEARLVAPVRGPEVTLTIPAFTDHVQKPVDVWSSPRSMYSTSPRLRLQGLELPGQLPSAEGKELNSPGRSLSPAPTRHQLRTQTAPVAPQSTDLAPGNSMHSPAQSRMASKDTRASPRVPVPPRRQHEEPLPPSQDLLRATAYSSRPGSPGSPCNSPGGSPGGSHRYPALVARSPDGSPRMQHRHMTVGASPRSPHTGSRAASPQRPMSPGGSPRTNDVRPGRRERLVGVPALEGGSDPRAHGPPRYLDLS